MQFRLKENETLLKDWVYSNTKIGKEKISSSLIVTNKRIIRTLEGNNNATIQETENANINGYQTYYGKRSALPGIICLIIALLCLVGGITVWPVCYGLAAVLLIVGLVLVFKRPSTLVLVLFKETPTIEAMQVGGIIPLKAKRKKAKKSAKVTKVKVRVDSKVAKEIATEIGTVLNLKDEIIMNEETIENEDEVEMVSLPTIDEQV